VTSRAPNPRRAEPPPGAVRPPARGGRDVKVIVRVDATALMRGHPVDGEVVEIAGGGPVPVSAVRELLPEALVAVVVTKGVDVASVAHAGRRLTAQQLTAIEWRTPVCTVVGCPCTVSLEDDHRHPWSEGGATRIGNLDRLCHHHHDLKTNHGFRLEPGTGRRRLLPPNHPDHPEHR